MKEKESGYQHAKPALRRLITRRRAIRWLALATMGLVVADALWWEPRVRIRIRRYKLVPNPQVRIVHFSDLHHRGNTRRLTRLGTKMMRYSPDFICFTGDIAEDIPCAREALQWLATLPVPVYGVPGNHDRWLGLDYAEFKAAFRATGGDWLDNARASIPSKQVNLVGAATADS